VARIVVPFRGAGAKRRLAAVGDEARSALALAMLGDVLAACTALAPTWVVTEDAAAKLEARDLGAELVADPGGGQGAAVAAALARFDEPVLVVNADVPCAVPHDLRALLAATPEAGLALTPAADGTTNALSLAEPGLFAPLYGAGSANRFCEHALSLGRDAVQAPIPNLVNDVDTMEDLHRLQFRLGPRSQAALAMIAGAA
jgi:2-phospho-L-lactate/phosphoenolpyruvate guanylyltransferase